MESEKSKYENFKHEIDFNQYIPITDEKTIKEFNQLEKPPDNIIKKPGKYKKSRNPAFKTLFSTLTKKLY